MTVATILKTSSANRRLFFQTSSAIRRHHRKRTLRPRAISAHPRPLRVTNHQPLLTIGSQASVSAGHSLCACSEENRYCLCDERHGFKEVSMCQAGAYSGPAHTHSFVPREQPLLFVAQYPHTSSTGTLLSCLSTPRTLGSRWQ